MTKAKALLLSDHHATADELRAAAAMIKAGKEVPFAPSVLNRVVAELAKPAHAAVMRVGRAVLWSPIGFLLLVLLLVMLGAIFVSLKR